LPAKQTLALDTNANAIAATAKVKKQPEHTLLTKSKAVEWRSEFAVS